MEFNQDNNVLAGRLLILSGIIYPGWSLIAQIITPWEYNDFYFRLTAGLVAISFGVFRDKFKNRFPWAIQFALTLYMVLFAYFTGASGGHERYLFGSLVLALGIFIGFLNYPKEFLIHALVSCISFIIFPKYFDVLDKVFPLVRQIIMFYVMMYFIARMTRNHTLLIEKLRAERLQLLDEHKTMITQNLKNAQAVFSSLGATQDELPESFKLRSFYRPAHDAGGDWIGHFYLKEKNWLVLTIGDVVGHDLPSSLVTIAVAGAARGTFESISHTTNDLEVLLKQMAISSNLAVRHCGIKDKSMSAAFLGIDLNTLQGVYINCAHPTGFWQGQNDVFPLETEASIYLGAEEFSLSVNKINFKGLKSIFLFTDGLIENDNHPIKEGRIARWMAKSDKFFNELSEKVTDITIQDDVSFLYLEVKTQ